MLDKSVSLKLDVFSRIYFTFYSAIIFLSIRQIIRTNQFLIFKLRELISFLILDFIRGKFAIIDINVINERINSFSNKEF